jgi:hypothetical protein
MIWRNIQKHANFIFVFTFIYQDEDQRSAFGYQQTLMYGRYSKALGEQLKEEARRIRHLEKQRKEEYRKQMKELRYKKLLYSRWGHKWPNSIYWNSL